jgi:SAM-dependent methyltransferase
MRSPTEIRKLVDQVTSFPLAERERIYHKHFEKPNNTVRFLCQYYSFDKKRILDATCHYGYYLAYFGEGSVGLDATPDFFQFAKEMGFEVQATNIEEPLPHFDEPFDGILFSGTLEEILSPHVLLVRFHQLLSKDGLLCIRVPSVPPPWFEKIARRRMTFGYDASAHLYFFTPRLIEMVIKRAGYEIVQTVSSGLVMNPWLRPFHNLLLPLSPAVTVIARARPDFKYPPVRGIRFLPAWANDLAPYFQDYSPDGGSSI